MRRSQARRGPSMLKGPSQEHRACWRNGNMEHPSRTEDQELSMAGETAGRGFAGCGEEFVCVYMQVL